MQRLNARYGYLWLSRALNECTRRRFFSSAYHVPLPVGAVLGFTWDQVAVSLIVLSNMACMTSSALMFYEIMAYRHNFVNLSSTGLSEDG